MPLEMQEQMKDSELFLERCVAYYHYHQLHSHVADISVIKDRGLLPIE